VAGGASLPLKVAGVGQVPADAVGAVVNVTATGGAGAGYLTVYPCGSTPPTASNVNFQAGANVPNLVTTALGGGQLCVFANVTTHVVIDLAGVTFMDSTGRLHAVSPSVLDTAARMAQSYTAPGQPGDADAVAVAVNLTATQATAPGYLTAYPCGGTVPLVSNVTSVGPDGAQLGRGAHRRQPLHLLLRQHAHPRIVDLAGAFSGSGQLTTVVPTACSTPAAAPAAGSERWATPRRSTSPSEARRVPGNASAVVLNVTATDATGPGYLTVFPCGGAVPLASNLNFTAGDTRANLVTVRLGSDGKVCFYSYGRTSVIADITGFLS
jgi:hypothetical protein